MFQQMEVTRAHQVPVQVEEVSYFIKGHDLNLPFSPKDGYTDNSAILRAQSMADMPGIKLYKIVDKIPTVLYDSTKRKVLKARK